jgi:hypothetical protein
LSSAAFCDSNLRGADGILTAAKFSGRQIGRQLVHLRVRVALRARRVQFLPGSRCAAKLLAPRKVVIRRHIRPRLLNCASSEAISVGRLPFVRSSSCETFFLRLPDGAGFGFAFEREQQLPGLHFVAARDGEIGERAAERRGDINIFTLDVALEPAGGTTRAAGQPGRRQREQPCRI